MAHQRADARWVVEFLQERAFSQLWDQKDAALPPTQRQCLLRAVLGRKKEATFTPASNTNAKCHSTELGIELQSILRMHFKKASETEENNAIWK